LDGDYPHVDSRKALERIAEVFAADRLRLQGVDENDDPNVVLGYCRQANINIVRLHPFLGMLIRSSNLRNAFEIYFPLKILSAEAVESDDTCVVLGSEWLFSPFTYPTALKELPEFIFIGVPASECQNPLIMPISGHELGHVVWQRRGAKKEFDQAILAEVVSTYQNNWNRFVSLFGPKFDVSKLETDMFLRRIWTQSYKLASRQLEEIFCDYLGIYIFGRSFLYSFRYLLSPSLGQYRPVNYPALRNRVRYLEHLASLYGIDAAEGFNAASFSDSPPTLSPSDQFVVDMADTVTEKLYGKLVGVVDKYHGSAEHFSQGAAEEERLHESLKKLVPPTPVTSIAALLNAAWDLRLSIADWHILPGIENDQRRTVEKLRVLRDLVLKGMEVYEYRKRIIGYAS
jgi:hypothetical protein